MGARLGAGARLTAALASVAQPGLGWPRTIPPLPSHCASSCKQPVGGTNSMAERISDNLFTLAATTTVIVAHSARDMTRTSPQGPLRSPARGAADESLLAAVVTVSS